MSLDWATKEKLMGEAWERENAAFQPGATGLSREKADALIAVAEEIQAVAPNEDFPTALEQWLAKRAR
jgi:hypothetical protein